MLRRCARGGCRRAADRYSNFCERCFKRFIRECIAAANAIPDPERGWSAALNGRDGGHDEC